VTPSNIIEAMAAPEWWKQWFVRGDWTAWSTFLAAAFALPPQDERALVSSRGAGLVRAAQDRVYRVGSQSRGRSARGKCIA
jgi:hypothetical protein